MKIIAKIEAKATNPNLSFSVNQKRLEKLLKRKGHINYIFLFTELYMTVAVEGIERLEIFWLKPNTLRKIEANKVWVIKFVEPLDESEEKNELISITSNSIKYAKIGRNNNQEDVPTS